MVLYKERVFFKAKGEEEMKRSLVLVSCIVVLGLMLSACASTPTAAPVKPAAATAAPTVAPSATPLVPPEKLVEKGKLLICSDAPYPPFESINEKGEWEGLDVDLGNEIATRLALKAQFVPTVFDTIIASVTSGKCDILISAMTINPDRNKQISFVPYINVGQSFVALKGNPENIKVPLDLCGKSVAAESGTVEVDYLKGTGDYLDKGLTQECTKAGKKAVNVVVTQKDSDAFQQLQAGKVVVYAADSPVAAFYLLSHGDQFQTVGDVIESMPEGIGIPCGAADCSTAPFSAIGKAVDTALKSMMADGTYDTIFKKWNLSNGSVKP
jgi:polar amino acid transport system substrate-binding protein